MKRTRKIFKICLEILLVVSFILMAGERPDGSMCIPWTLGWLCVFYLTARVLCKFFFDKESS